MVTVHLILPFKNIYMKLLMTLGVCCTIVLQLSAQATKKPAGTTKPSSAAKPATSAKPATAGVKKVAATSSTLKNSIDSFSYAVGLSLASFYKEQGVENI